MEKVFPSPHVEMRVSVSEQMEADIKECDRRSRAGESRKCDECSWFELEIAGTGLCDIADLRNKILGRNREEE